MTTESDRNNWGAVTCGGHTQAGKPCGKPAIRGTQPPRCERHSGKTKTRAKAEGQIRMELAHWGVDEQIVDPAEQFLKLIAQSARRAAQYAELLGADYMDRDVAALVGVTYVAASKPGAGEAVSEPVQSGEYIRGLAHLEMDERAFCARLCAQAITAGIEERRVRLAERQFDLMDQVLRAVLLELGHDPDSPDVRRVVSGQILQLTS